MTATDSPPSDDREDPRGPARTPARALAWAAVALAVGLALRVWEAVESSLWLDELHTLSHAAQPTVDALLASVRAEVHTPLFFLAVQHFGGGAPGVWSSGAWMRVIPVLSSLLVAWPLWSLTRSARAGDRAGAPGGPADGSRHAARAAALAVGLWALLPYQVHWATELRPYAWVALFSAGAVWAAYSDRGPALARGSLFFLCVLLGLYTHRIMALTVFAIGAARLPSFRRPGRLHLGWLVALGTVAVAPFLAWLVGFAGSATEARFDYQESVGGYTLRPTLVKEVLALPVRVFVPYLGALGGGWALLARGGAALFFGALGLGAWLRFAHRRELGPSGFLLRGLALFAAAAFLVITALSIWTWDRVPLQYYAPLAWLLPLFAAEALAPLEGGLGRGLRGAAVAGALLLGVAQAGGDCTEDMRRGVAAALELGERALEVDPTGQGPAYTALLNQPDNFEHGLPYLAYAPGVRAVEPEEVPALDPRRPLVVLRRGGLRPDHPAWEPLLRGRRIVTETTVDAYLGVFLLMPDLAVPDPSIPDPATSDPARTDPARPDPGAAGSGG